MQIKGIYRVPVSDELLAEAMDIKFGDLDLSSSERQEAEAQVRQELDSPALIDTVISDGGRGFDVGDFLTKWHMKRRTYHWVGTALNQVSADPEGRYVGSSSSCISSTQPIPWRPHLALSGCRDQRRCLKR